MKEYIAFDSHKRYTLAENKMPLRPWRLWLSNAIYSFIRGSLFEFSHDQCNLIAGSLRFHSFIRISDFEFRRMEADI